MAIKNWNLFKAGFFKNAKSLFSAPQRVQKALLNSEAGTVGLEVLPLAVGFFSNKQMRMSWMASEQHKAIVKETGESVIEITERSYIPCDPFGKFSDEDKKKLQPLDEIALARHDEYKMQIIENWRNAAKSSIYQPIVVGCICVIIIVIVSSIFG